ncbi:NAD(P)/FAD-dependent oxidoreductase [Trinickia symbiotica]|uniref:NAD(P)/FAD-dependent oxidoreductase n=1 Tax=Trinickia symbiotica TaxID=863227 RepID=A0A2T3XQY5_9BURK|nr:NAD(P)/FAD-dependent oxidoreductase [Trinickia symbiotica]PTB18939.1 NAD(P)/FAD-dependent oxidoreductase [Trinickia symbiotica]
MTPNGRKVIIIGAGIAGLCAGVLARKCGYEVDIVEQHERPGGLATSWRRGDYTFEGCLHWLLGSNSDDPMYEQWHEVFDIDRVGFFYPEKWMTIVNERGDHLDIYSDVDQMEGELLRQSPQDELEIRRLAAAARGLRHCPLPQPGNSWIRDCATRLRLLPYFPLLRKWGRVSAGEYGTRYHSPLLRAFFGDGEMSHLSALALVFSMAWVSNRNAGYPIGGSKAVIGRIADRFVSMGGRLQLGEKVCKILVEHNAAVGIQLEDGERMLADWVISAADGHATIFDLLDGKYVDEATRHLYRTLEPFPSWIQVSLGVALDLSQYCGYITRVLDHPLTVDPGTRLRQVSFRVFHFDPHFSPPGKTALTCTLPTRNVEFWAALQAQDPARYKAEKNRIADAVIAIIERSTEPLRHAVEVVDVSTPATVIRHTGNWKGSMEGWLPTPETGFRPLASTLAGLHGFVMAGQWVMPGGGLPSGLITARQAVRHLCRHDGVRFAVQEPTALPMQTA